MSDENQYACFVRAFLSRGAVGVAVGFAAVAPATAKELPVTNNAGLHFVSGRLAAIRSAVTEVTKSNRALDLKVTQNFANR